MAEKEKQIIDMLSKTLPKLTDPEKDRLLAFSEGMAYVARTRDEDEKAG